VNGLSLLGVALNLLFAVLCKASGEYDGLGTFLVGSALLSGLGIGLVAIGQLKAGAITVIVGSVVFVPLGLIAVVGARKTLDKLTQAEFEHRRSRAKVGR
jgi:membrane protein implicated in regulation of membrane protease activity